MFFWRVPKVAPGCLLAHYWSLWLSFWFPLAPFWCLRDPLWCPRSPKTNKNTRKIKVFEESPKSLRGCLLAHYWSLWLSFWLPLAPFWCLRDPLWCPKGLKMTPWAFILGEIRVTRTVRVPRWVPGPQKDNFWELFGSILMSFRWILSTFWGMLAATWEHYFLNIVAYHLNI